MIRKKFPKNAKQRKKLGNCLRDDGWTLLDIQILLGYKMIIPEKFNSFQNMVYNDDDIRLRMVNFYLEKFDIRAEISKEI